MHHSFPTRAYSFDSILLATKIIIHRNFHSGESLTCCFMSLDVYHLWPESAEVAERLQRPHCLMAEEEIARQLQTYRREVQGLQDTYSNCLKIINADQPHKDVFAQGVNTFN